MFLRLIDCQVHATHTGLRRNLLMYNGAGTKRGDSGGLVTAIPKCVSFAAYAVAFCFPSRRDAEREGPV